jgi:ribonuclease HI
VDIANNVIMAAMKYVARATTIDQTTTKQVSQAIFEFVRCPHTSWAELAKRQEDGGVRLRHPRLTFLVMRSSLARTLLGTKKTVTYPPWLGPARKTAAEAPSAQPGTVHESLNALTELQLPIEEDKKRGIHVFKRQVKQSDGSYKTEKVPLAKATLKEVYWAAADHYFGRKESSLYARVPWSKFIMQEKEFVWKQTHGKYNSKLACNLSHYYPSQEDPISATCPMCETAKETVDHVNGNCHVARQLIQEVWNTSVFFDALETNEEDDKIIKTGKWPVWGRGQMRKTKGLNRAFWKLRAAWWKERSRRIYDAPRRGYNIKISQQDIDQARKSAKDLVRQAWDEEMAKALGTSDQPIRGPYCRESNSERRKMLEEGKPKKLYTLADVEQYTNNLPVGDVVVYTDGSCTGNPGPCGAGYTATILEGKRQVESVEAKHRTREGKYHGTVIVQGAVPLGKNNTNNFGELYAIGAAANSIQRVRSPETSHDAHVHHIRYTTMRTRPKIGSIHILTDSLYSANVITGQWKACNNQKVAAWTTRQVHALKRSGVKVFIHWVKAHIGIPGNEKADRLANEGREINNSRKVDLDGVRPLFDTPKMFMY